MRNPSPVPPRLVKTPAAVHPLPSERASLTRMGRWSTIKIGGPSAWAVEARPFGAFRSGLSKYALGEDLVVGDA